MITQKQIVTLGGAVIILIVGIVLVGKLTETVDKGTYHIKQAAISGTMTAHMDPGLYCQCFGDREVWSRANTFFFTQGRDVTQDTDIDNSIEVRFNDGSIARISGTLRVVMPTSPQQAIDLVTVQGYRSYADLEAKLIRPSVRNALRLTANLMSARQSYSEKRADFNAWASDQIQNGLYQTEEKTERIKDLVSGEEVIRTFKVIKRDEQGNFTRQSNPFAGTGLRLANFEIKEFVYANRVKAQIQQQQEALMAVATAAAQAKKAEQDAKTMEAQGKARVTKAKYEEEELKIKAVVQAQRDKEVAETQARKLLEVAKLEKQAAVFQKQRDILQGQGEAEKKRLIIQADGALKEKLAAYTSVMAKFADAYSKRKVPQLVMGGSGRGDTDTQSIDFQSAMQLLVAKQLGLDLGIRSTGPSE
jgi:hypothetical protein